MTQQTATSGVKDDKSNPAPTKQEQDRQAQQAAELQRKTAELGETKSQMQALKEELEILKQAGIGGRQSGPGQYAPQAVPQDHAHRQLEALWESDPKRAMQTELQMALQWYDQSNAAVEIQADEVAKKHADFNKYRSEVNRYLRTIPIETRTKPGVVEAAYFYVRGQKVDDLVNLSREELIAKIRNGERVQGLEGAPAGAYQPAPTPDAKPTAEQINVAAAMNMSVEDYMKHVKR